MNLPSVINPITNCCVTIIPADFHVFSQDILANDSIKLDWTFRYSLINDIIKVCIIDFFFNTRQPAINAYHARADLTRGKGLRSRQSDDTPPLWRDERLVCKHYLPSHYVRGR